MPTIPWEQVREVVDAVLDLPPEKRSSYLDQVCPESSVRRYVESLVVSFEHANKFLDEPAVAHCPEGVEPDDVESWNGRRVGPYQVAEEIGRGGMGSVYRALRADDQYQKEVAIKVVRGGVHTGLSLARFRAERQILADLDHPNIARLLEGGSTEDGQPYFVMEYIQGEPLDLYCDKYKLTVTGRLELFRTVCSAVQYAHQKLVIHRDIKPSNILVAKQGIPKLLDFGIAKILGPDSGLSSPDRTNTMVRLLTPEYASPEQWRGETITTSSDVYSLGVVLYELLTGHRPYSLSTQRPDEMIRVVTQTEPERPSNVISRIENTIEASGKSSPLTPETVSATREGTPEKLRRRLAGDLDNIILMALRKEPQRRYASVEQFSEDLRRHLAGLPVIARSDTVAYRSGKFIRRHLAGVTAAALVALSLTVGLVVAVRQAHIARIERARAENRFNDVRDLANSLISGVYDSIEDLPGSTTARKLIVDKALHYLDSLSRESQGDASLQRELAAAYKRIGDVQGNEASANLGDSAGSLKSYQKALEIRKALMGTNPGNVPDALNLAESLRLVAGAILLNNETAQAFRYSRQATEVAESLDRADSNDLLVLKELSQDYSTEASILGGNFNLSNLGDTASALAVRQKEVAVDERIVNSAPSDPAAKRGLAVSLARMGDQFQLSGQRRTALQHYMRAEKIFEDLAAGSASRKALEALQSIYNRVFFAEQATGNRQEALANARKALEVARKLSSADPSDIRSGLSVAIDYTNLADILSATGHLASAKSALNEALTALGRLVASNPTNGELPGVQASAYVTAGDVFRLSGEYEKSLRYYRDALTILSRIHSQDPDDKDGVLQLAGGYNQTGKVLVRKRDFVAATEMFRKGLALSEPEERSGHPNEETLYSVADSYTGLGEVEAARANLRQSPKDKAEHLTQARSWYERSLTEWSQIKEPGFLSPEGYDSVPPSAVKQHLAEVIEALAQGSGKIQSQP